MKDILVQYYSITGFVTESPREVLRESFKAKLISDDVWMDMLKVRNELAHDYDCEVVRTHCNTIVEKYIDLFYDFSFLIINAEDMSLALIGYVFGGSSSFIV